MEISKSLIQAFVRHTKILIEKGKFDCKDVKTANALRLARKEIYKIERKIYDDRNIDAGNC